jgi:hypothetical protein
LLSENPSDPPFFLKSEKPGTGVTQCLTSHMVGWTR